MILEREESADVGAGGEGGDGEGGEGGIGCPDTSANTDLFFGERAETGLILEREGSGHRAHKDEGVGMSAGEVEHEGVDTGGGVVMQGGLVMDDGEVAESLHACWSSGRGLEQENGVGIVEAGLDEHDNDPLNARLTQLGELVEKNREEAVRNITYAQPKQKLCYDLKHKGVYYKPGDLVLKRNFYQSEDRWIGPYEVVGMTGKGSFYISVNGVRQKNAVNSMNLKLSHSPIAPTKRKAPPPLELDPEDTALAHDLPDKRTKTSPPAPQESPIQDLRYSLADDKVAASQSPMKAKFPNRGSLQIPLSGRAVRGLAIFDPIEVTHSRSVQLHYFGGFHWMATSWDGCSLKFYNSLYSKAHLEYAKDDISTLYRNFVFGDVEVESVPQQNVSTGCCCYARLIRFESTYLLRVI